MMNRAGFHAAIAAAACAGMAAPALADVKAGVDAWSRGDYTGAVKEWQGPADKGDSDALFNLGQAYKLGRGVKPDLAKAEDLFSRAAQRGHPQAADNYGLLLFQRGEHARAMPYISAAAERGDARAQYLLGIAHFNGDTVAKDWVRAYALVSLAQQAGLSQATAALAQMDQYIPIEQRQQSVSLASQLASEAQAVRARQMAAVDLGVADPGARPAPVLSDASVPMGKPATREPFLTPEQAVAAASRAAGTDTPRTAGADYARPKAPVVSTILNERPQPARTSTPATSAPATPAAPKPVPTPKPPQPAPPPAPATAGGAWRIQLGAFGVPGNADALWNRVKARPEIAGHPRINAPAGRLTKLQAGGFASQGEAQAACSRLSAAGFTCMPVRN